MDNVKKNKLISIVIPNFNDPRIERSLESIISQTSEDYEIIIVEGCLKNNLTKKIYENYKEHIDLLIHERDHGIFDAFNKGILNSKCPFVLIIGSDDVLSDDQCIITVRDEILQSKGLIDGVSLDCRFKNSNNKIFRIWKNKKITSNRIKWGLMPPHLSLILNRTLYDQIGFFDFDKTYIAADTDWLLRLATFKDVHIIPINGHYLDMQQGGASTGSLKYIFKSLFLIAKSARKYGIVQWPLTPIIKVLSKLLQLRL